MDGRIGDAHWQGVFDLVRVIADHAWFLLDAADSGSIHQYYVSKVGWCCCPFRSPGYPTDNNSGPGPQDPQPSNALHWKTLILRSFFVPPETSDSSSTVDWSGNWTEYIKILHLETHRIFLVHQIESSAFNWVIIDLTVQLVCNFDQMHNLFVSVSKVPDRL